MAEHTRVVEEQGVVGLGVPDKPAYGADNVGLGGLHDGVRLVVGQDDHVFPLVPMVLDEEGRQIVDVVDTATQLALLAKVVDTDEKSLSLARAVGVLEGIAVRGAMAEFLGLRGRGRAGTGVVSSVAGVWERISVGVETGRRRVLRGWRPAVGVTLVPTAMLSVSSIAVTGTRPGRGRAWRRRVLGVLLVSLIAWLALVALVRAASSSSVRVL